MSPRVPRARAKPAVKRVLTLLCGNEKMPVFTARKGQWPSASRVVRDVFCESDTRFG